MQELAKFIIFLGVILIIIGTLIFLMPKIPFIGKLPGDIHIQKDNFHFYFPLTTSIIISIIITAILWLLNVFRK